MQSSHHGAELVTRLRRGGVATLKADWTLPYSREEAAYPMPGLRRQKYWSPVGRVDNVYGDRNLFCACVPVENYYGA